MLWDVQVFASLRRTGCPDDRGWTSSTLIQSYQRPGRRWSDELSLSLPPSRLRLFGQRFKPHPINPHGCGWGGGGGVRCQRMLWASIYSKRAPDAPRWPPRWLKIAEDGLISPLMYVRNIQQGHETAPRAPKSAPRAGQESPKTACLSLRGVDRN